MGQCDRLAATSEDSGCPLLLLLTSGLSKARDTRRKDTQCFLLALTQAVAELQSCKAGQLSQAVLSSPGLVCAAGAAGTRDEG